MDLKKLREERDLTQEGLAGLSGVYALDSVVFVTANKQRLAVSGEPESHLRVKDVPQEAYVNGWELEGGERVGKFEDGTNP